MNQTTRSRKTYVVGVIALAGAALGVGTAFAVASGSDGGPEVRVEASEDAPKCPTPEDLLRAADAARILEAQRPDLFAGNPRRADANDLRLAAEWAARVPGSCPR